MFLEESKIVKKRRENDKKRMTVLKMKKNVNQRNKRKIRKNQVLRNGFEI